MGSVKDVDDRFKKFGTVSFTAVSRVNEFIDFLEKGRVAGTRCPSCGTAFFPPRADCARCLVDDMEWFEVQRPGRLVTYSRLQFAPEGFQEDVPYSIALLDFGDFKMFGRIAPEVPEDALELGMEMVPAVRSLPNGQLTYEFRVAAQE
jgi:uncharacterized OB-fold protein